MRNFFNNYYLRPNTFECSLARYSFLSSGVVIGKRGEAGLVEPKKELISATKKLVNQITI